VDVVLELHHCLVVNFLSHLPKMYHAGGKYSMLKRKSRCLVTAACKVQNRVLGYGVAAAGVAVGGAVNFGSSTGEVGTRPASLLVNVRFSSQLLRDQAVQRLLRILLNLGVGQRP
jgi:hypothetical protein